MQFKHPELLYALFLLIIPIIIHLFQLRRFKKVPFTNVKFLKSVKLQTRKSAQLKKWLTLLTRMLLLACTIIAFAQPFIPTTENFNKVQETVIYLDNSFSMQAKGVNGSLLNEAVQDIINTFPEDQSLSLFTNSKTYKNTSIKAIKNELIQLAFSNNQLTYDAAYLKAKQLFSNNSTTLKNIVFISDFQQNGIPLNFKKESFLETTLVQLKPAEIHNISIDSIYISSKNTKTIEVSVVVSSTPEPTDNISISLFNDDVLLSKSAVDISENSSATFSLANNKVINGKLVVEDAALQFDNTFFFNINQKPKVNILAINADTDDTFLKKIYTPDEFNFESLGVTTLNYNLIPNQNLIILNELHEVPNALIPALKAFKNDGGSLLIIPSDRIDINTYNQLLKDLFNNRIEQAVPFEKKITSINYDHPLLKNAFYAKVTNFQYPKVNTSYTFSSSKNKVLSFEDGRTFLYGDSKNYLFTSALNTKNSNFKNSPLIVPVLYNIGLESLELSKLYYTIGLNNRIAIKTVIGQDDILSLVSDKASVIPLQKTYNTFVAITTGEFPERAGIIAVKNKDSVVENLSFNYSREESNLSYHDLTSLDGITINNSLASAMDSIKSNTNVNALWKWFVTFALIFLFIEMLLLKYLK